MLKYSKRPLRAILGQPDTTVLLQQDPLGICCESCRWAVTSRCRYSARQSLATCKGCTSESTGLLLEKSICRGSTRPRCHCKIFRFRSKM